MTRTRSQRPTQSQQPKRKGKQRARDDEDEDDEEMAEDTQNGHGEEDDGDDDEDVEFRDAGGSPSKNANEEELDRKASDLVRLALFHEHRRTPLKREEITKKVSGSSSRSFNAVLERAQRTLRNVFGMELVELQSRAEREKDTDATNPTNAEGKKKGGASARKKSTPAGSKTYILRSTLDPLIIEYAALTDEKILEQELSDAPSDEDEGSQLRNFGSIISWSSSDQLSSIGILYVILALILVNGRVMAENDIRAVLKQFRLTPNAKIPLDNKTTNKLMQTNNYLSLLQKQGYLERSVISEQKAGGKRTRVPAATQGGADGSEDLNNIQWKWGGRAHSEVGEKGIAKFVAEFMVERMIENKDNGDGDGDDEEAQEKQRGDDLQRRRLEVMMNGIQRAAGGDLSDVK